MELRDDLARLRTELANERTFLAWLRTGLGLIAAGAALIRFFQDPGTITAGWILVAGGVASFVGGIIRFRSVRARLRRVVP